MKRTALIASLALASLWATAPAQDSMELVRVTTHPADDYEPAVSPDGRWLVYTSERDGAPGLYLRDLKSKTPRPDERLFPHPARTFSPVFSPDGKWLAFVSHREDALGDVFLANFSSRHARRVSALGRIDRAPRFSPDGKHLYFESTRINEATTLQSYSISGGQLEEVSADADVLVVQPPYPIQSLDRTAKVALLYADDTNSDGTTGTGDSASPWEIQNGEWRQIYTPLADTRGVCRNVKTGEILLGASFDGNGDIAAIGAGTLRDNGDPKALMALARAAIASPRPRTDEAISFYRAATRRAVDPEIRSQAAMRYIRTLIRAERFRQALTEMDTYLSDSGSAQERLALRTSRAIANMGLALNDPNASLDESATELRDILTQAEAENAPDMVGFTRLALARGLAERDRVPEALAEVEKLIASNEGESGGFLRARAILLKARLYEKTGLSSEMRDTILSLFRSDLKNATLLEEAAARLIATTVEGSVSADERILRLRDLAAQAAELPYLLAALKLEEGRLLLEEEDYPEAERALRVSLAKAADAPEPALEATQLLAGVYTARQDYDAIIALYDEFETAVSDNEDDYYASFVDTAKRRLSTYYLRKARREQALGDPLLALSTYEKLLKLDPGLPAAWRGKLAAMSTQSGLVESKLPEYRRERDANRGSALAWYKVGLAESYLEPDSDRARKSLLTAIANDPSVPYYYLTLGFVYEQQYRRSTKARSKKLPLLEESALAYEQALLLADREFDPEFFGDAMLNSANAALELGQNFRAHDFYRRRAELDFPFLDKRTEFLFHYNGGVAAFRASFPAVAGAEFGLAGAMLEDLKDEKLIPEENVESLRLDLLGRRALALMESREYPESAALFQRLYNEAPAKSLRQVRALRNRAVVIERQLAGTTGYTRARLLEQGMETVDRAIAALQEPGLFDDSVAQESGSLLSFSVVVSTGGAAGGSQLKFDDKDEMRLLRALKARFAQLSGAHASAIEELQAQLDLSPPITDENRAYYMSVQSVTYSRLAGEAAKAGNREAAMSYAEESLSRCRYEIVGVEFVNGAGATLALAQLAETALAAPDDYTLSPGTFWMLRADEIADASRWEMIDRAAERLLTMPDPALGDPNVPLVIEPVQLVRLLYVRALANERMAFEYTGTGETELVSGANRTVYTTRAREFAGLAKAVAETASAGVEEANRLAILSSGTIVRADFSYLLQGAEERLAEFRTFARETGHAHLEWWLQAQAAVSHPDPTKRAQLAADCYDVYTAQGSYNPDAKLSAPWLLFDELEAAELAPAVEADEPESCWNISDRWRVARLRWLAEDSSPQPSGSEDAQWLEKYRGLANTYRESQARLRQLPYAAVSRRQSAIAEGVAALETLVAHVQDGRASELPTARYLRPESGGFDYVAVLLEPPFLVPRDPMLVLKRNLPGLSVSAVYTPEESRFVTEEFVPPADHEVFLLGDRPAALTDVTAIVDSIGFYGKFQKLSLRSGAEQVVFPSSGAVTISPAMSTELGLASELAISVPVLALGETPDTWRVADRTLGELVSLAPNLETISLDLSGLENVPVMEREARELALASWLDERGVVRATINDRKWLGFPLDPKRLPELAKEEVALAEGALDRALAANEARSSVISLERIIAIKEALGDEENLQWYYGTLAVQRGSLNRWGDAFVAAERRLEILRDESAPEEEIAGALTMLGDVATNARKWPEAEDAYGQAAAIYDSLEDESSRASTIRSLAISLENAGEYRRALETGDDAQKLFQNLNDPKTALNQDIRAARIYRIYLNDYAEAGRLLTDAAETAKANDWMDLRVEAQLNLARVLHSTARFDEALILLDRIEDEVGPNATDTIAQINLERANVHWYRADYFDSFREQQVALDLAQTENNIPVQIAIHNVSGLTSWTINDLERAFSELERALALAESERIDAEVATTANNIGLVFRSQKDFAKARSWFERALEIDRLQSNRWGQAYALRNIGITLTQEGKPAEAVEPLSQAIDLAGAIGDRVNTAKALLALGDANKELARLSEAKSLYEKALFEARSVVLPEVEWRALHGLGEVALAENDQDAALRHFGEAIDVVDIVRAAIRIEEFQDGFLLDKLDLYDSMISLRIDRKEYAEALEMSEKSRGRNFIDLLGNRRLSLGEGADEGLLRREDELRTKVENLERSLASATGPKSEQLSRELESARTDYSDFLIVLRAQSPQLSNFVRVSPVDIAELQGLLDSETRLVIYHILPSGPVAWVLGSDSLDFFVLPGTPEQVSTDVLATRQGLQNFEDVKAPLAALGTQLLEPLLPALAGAKHVGIVPHRELHTLPFAALRLANGEDLVDRFALFYTPSASVLRYTIGRRDGRMANNRVLAIGNPDRGAAMSLPFAEKEAERLRFSFDDVTIKVGEQASESWLKDNFADYGIVHIASHGEYKPEAPLFSAVLLSSDSQNDGILSAEEVFGLELRADLVALSACQSGLGRIGSGDDIVGLNRSFVYAGTRQLLTTLWRVDDISTAVLFKYFYRNQDQTDRAEALRQAQIRLKNRPEYGHPAHWAGLVLSGDWQ